MANPKAPSADGVMDGTGTVSHDPGGGAAAERRGLKGRALKGEVQRAAAGGERRGRSWRKEKWSING